MTAGRTPLEYLIRLQVQNWTMVQAHRKPLLVGKVNREHQIAMMTGMMSQKHTQYFLVRGKMDIIYRSALTLLLAQIHWVMAL